MEFEKKFAIGCKRLYQDLEIVAVISGIAVGWFAVVISRLIDGPHEWDWIGAAVGASVSAALLARQRERSRHSLKED
jgi:hypothetical protein